MLSLAVFIPVQRMGGIRLGARTVFASAIAIFSLASILCGISNGLLGVHRGQNPAGHGRRADGARRQTGRVRTTEKKDLVRSIAYITWPGLAAPVIGPPVGGFITT